MNDKIKRQYSKTKRMRINRIVNKHTIWPIVRVVVEGIERFIQ
jgi:hypothetical protein